MASSKLKSRAPSGRPTRAGQSRELPPTQVRRLRDAALRGLREPEWGTELGRLYLAGKLTDSHYSAGKKWGELAYRYRQVILAPDAKPLSLEIGRGGTPPDPDSPEGRTIIDRDSAIASRFLRACAVLSEVRAEWGVNPLSIVRRICEDGGMICGHAELLTLRVGLQQVFEHLDMGRR